MNNKLKMIIYMLAMIFYFTNCQVIFAYNCGSQENISTKLVHYTSDDMYQKKLSTSSRKKNLPSSIIDPQDRQLLISQRITQQLLFSYHLNITHPGQYILVFKFIEVVYKYPNERVFQIKFGEDVISTIDIIKQIGYGQILHKWVEFDLEDEVIYVNKTYPCLNAYSFQTKQLKVIFQRVYGNPKIQAMLLIYGTNSPNFLQQYLTYQQTKNIIIKQLIAEKYYNIQHHQDKIRIKGFEQFDFEQYDFWYYFYQFYSLHFLASVIATLFLLNHEQIYNGLKMIYPHKNKQL